MKHELCPGDAALDALLRGDLPQAEQTAVTEHVDGCPSCSTALDELRLASSYSGLLRAARERLAPERRRELIDTATRLCRGLPETEDLADALDGAPDASPDNADSSPPQIPDYELLRPLGEGHFGQVWLGRSNVTGGHRAIKLVRRARVLDIERGGLQSFEVMAERHPNLIEIQHVGEVDDFLYYVMELADGYSTSATFSTDDYVPRTLESELGRRGHLTLEEAARVTFAMLDALEYLHTDGPQQLLHRDVKPGNIVYAGGTPKLIDIGLLTPMDRREVEAGTPTYMPPEGVVDASGDLYCLGKTLYQMVSGCRPTFTEAPRDASAREALRAIQPVLERACDPDRKNRFQRAREFREALRGLPELAPDEVASEPPASRWTRIALSGAALAVLLLGALWVQTVFGGSPEALLQIRYTENESPDGFEGRVDAGRRDVPLPNTGWIQLLAELDEPAYAVIVYCDEVNQETNLLYPSTDMSATKLDEALSKRSDHASSAFPLNGDGEAMTFILLTSDDPIVASDDPFNDPGLREVLAEIDALGSAPRCKGAQLIAVGETGTPEVLGANATTRGIDTEAGRTLADPADAHAGRLERLHETLEGRFELVRALVVPQGAADQ